MAKKTKNPGAAGTPTRETVARVGIGALLLGLVTWAVGPTTKDNAVEWVKIIVFAVGVALLIRWPLIEPFKIPSGSMEPTLNGRPEIGRGDRVFVNKWVYGVRYPFTKSRIWHGQDPQRWDIVVFKNPQENARHGTLVKRIVGLPGERVQTTIDGHVSINGNPIEPPPGVDIRYGAPGGGAGQFVYGVLNDEAFSVVPEGHYLVMGDNRGNSADGRVFGWLPNGHILGRVACIWWPPPRWRDFTGFTQTWWWKTFLALLGVWLVVRLFFGRSWHVRHKVDTALAPGDHVYVNRAAFGVPLPFTGMRVSRGREPRRGEMVIYRPNGAEDHELLAGRVAGLPGEKIQVDQGRVAINGQAIEKPEDLAQLPAAGNGFSRKPQSVVPDNHYFILTENGAEGLAWIPRTNVVGPVSAVWWPPRRWRRVRP